MKPNPFFKIGVLCIVLFVSSNAVAQASYPTFSEEYWIGQQEEASGKMMRGGGLAVVGVAAVIPAAIWVDKAFENPHKYAALGAVASIAAVSMALHGFNSIGFGKEQRDTATKFVQSYQNNPQDVDQQAEGSYYIDTQKKTTGKLILFGSVLTTQAAILLTNGIVLSVKKNSGDDIGGAKLWPSYVFGGLLLSAGVALIVKNTKRYKDLKNLATQPLPVTQTLSLQPFFYVDDATGGSTMGLSGQIQF